MSIAFKPLRIGLTVCALVAIAAFAQSRVSAAGGIQSACGGQQFTDVCPGDWYYSYVTDLVSSGAVSGYSDGTFRPNATVTRGQIMKVIVLAFGLDGAPPGEQTFTDVPPSNPFYDWIEAAAAHGDVNGYNCGGAGEPCDAQRRQYFHPTANVNRGQIAKMVVNAMGWSIITPQTPTFRDVPTASAYFGYVETAGYYGVLSGYNCGASNEPCPGRYFRPLVSTTRGQAAKIIDPPPGCGPPQPLGRQRPREPALQRRGPLTLQAERPRLRLASPARCSPPTTSESQHLRAADLRPFEQLHSEYGVEHRPARRFWLRAVGRRAHRHPLCGGAKRPGESTHYL